MKYRVGTFRLGGGGLGLNGPAIQKISFLPIYSINENDTIAWTQIRDGGGGGGGGIRG